MDRTSLEDLQRVLVEALDRGDRTQAVPTLHNSRVMGDSLAHPLLPSLFALTAAPEWGYWGFDPWETYRGYFVHALDLVSCWLDRELQKEETCED